MTGMSRRSLIGAGAAGLAVTAVGLRPALAAAEAGFTARPTLYVRSRFAPLRGKGFSLVRDGKGTAVVLRQVADIAGAPAGAEEAFRLTFSARGTPPAQGTYSLRRSGFTATSVFVVPDAERGGVTAIINSAR